MKTLMNCQWSQYMLLRTAKFCFQGLSLHIKHKVDTLLNLQLMSKASFMHCVCNEIPF